MWVIYLADFGLSRSFSPEGHGQTDGPTARTPRYCAPEVYNHEFRGRSAGIFSLGCVFLEILTVFCNRHPQVFADYRRGNGVDDSFRTNLDKVSWWVVTRFHSFTFRAKYISPGPMQSVLIPVELIKTVEKMIQPAPENRLTAAHLQECFQETKFGPLFRAMRCCSLNPEPYIEYERT